MNNYENLANAIILKAVKDYRKARRTLAKKPEDASASLAITRLIQFFHSEYFCVLSNLDPVALLERLDQEGDT